MRKLLLSLFCAVVMSFAASAQTNETFYAGKWALVIYGTPQGDAKLNVVIENKDKAWQGVVQDTAGKEISKLTNIKLKDKSLTGDFTAEGYDLTLALDPVDENNVKGSVMNMFDVKGVRVKEN